MYYLTNKAVVNFKHDGQTMTVESNHDEQKTRIFLTLIAEFSSLGKRTKLLRFFFPELSLSQAVSLAKEL
jgi:hypothetical protein